MCVCVCLAVIVPGQPGHPGLWIQDMAIYYVMPRQPAKDEIRGRTGRTRGHHHKSIHLMSNTCWQGGVGLG